MSDPYQQIGYSALLNISLVLLCISLSWWALSVFRFDVLVRDPKGPQAKLLRILLSVLLGYGTGKFLIDYFTWSTLLRWMF